MASNAGRARRSLFQDDARLIFLGDTSKCEACSKPQYFSMPARVLCRSMSTFIETKAAYNCFDFTVIPLLGYVSSDVMISPQLLRFFLSSLHNVDEATVYLVKTFLEIHLHLHPPCRPGMPKYYLAVLNQQLDSTVFDQTKISETFFDFVKRFKAAINERALTNKVRVQAKKISTGKDAIDFLKRACQATTQPNRNAYLQFDMIHVVFNYCVDVLIHDFQIARRRSVVPLVVQIVWGDDPDQDTPMNPHCTDIINMFFRAPPSHRSGIARYLSLLASIVQKGDPTHNVYDFDTNDIVVALVEKMIQDEPLTIDSVTLINTLPSHMFRLHISQHLLYEALLDNAVYPKKTRKYFSLFDKKKRKK